MPIDELERLNDFYAATPEPSEEAWAKLRARLAEPLAEPSVVRSGMQRAGGRLDRRARKLLITGFAVAIAAALAFAGPVSLVKASRPERAAAPTHGVGSPSARSQHVQPGSATSARSQHPGVASKTHHTGLVGTSTAPSTTIVVQHTRSTSTPTSTVTATTRPHGSTTTTTTTTPVTGKSGGSVSVGDSTLFAGQAVTVSATGFAPNSSVTIELHSTPTVLATVQSSVTGNVATSVTIPSNAATGAHEIVAVGTSPSGGSLQASTPVTVGFDSTPPNVMSANSAGAIRLSTNSIDTSGGGQTVTMTLEVQDAGSGLSNSATSSVMFSNGSTDIYGCIAVNSAWTGGGTCTRTSGTANDGNYTVNLYFPAQSPAGTYTLQFIHLADAAGNTINYSPSSLSSLGYGNEVTAITNS